MLGRKKQQQDSRPGRRRSLDGAERRPSAAELANKYAFKRNRTLTGSSSASIASSNELNAELRSPRAHVHHLTGLRRKLLASFIGVALISLGLYVLVSQMVATTVIAITGQPPLNVSAQSPYAKAIEAYYAARPVERFRFLLNEPALVSHVQSTLPEVASIRVEPGSKLGEATLTLKAREPIAHWSINGVNEYVDGEGVVFAKSYFADPKLQIVDDSGLPASSSKLVTSNRFLGFIGRVVAKSSASGLDVAKVTIPALTTRQVAVTLAGQGTEYRLSVDRSAGNQVEDITRINRYLASNKLTPGYVDVRISGKAFYK